MGAAKVLPYYNVKDWERWEGAWELIDGMPFAMSPAPLPKHQQISGRIFTQFDQQFETCSVCNIYPAIDWIINEDTILQPDLVVVCGEIQHRLDFAPQLVVEILSKATALKDRNNKFHIYEKQGVKYYLIVNPENNSLEIFEHNGNNYELKDHQNQYRFVFNNDGCTADIEFSHIW